MIYLIMLVVCMLSFASGYAFRHLKPDHLYDNYDYSKDHEKIDKVTSERDEAFEELHRLSLAYESTVLVAEGLSKENQDYRKEVKKLKIKNKKLKDKYT
jgi:hypothetical protein